MTGGSKGSDHFGRHYKCLAMHYGEVAMGNHAKGLSTKLCITRNTEGTSVPKFQQLTMQLGISFPAIWQIRRQTHNEAYNDLFKRNIHAWIRAET